MVIGGFLYLAWAIFGYVVEYRKGIEWRAPIRWSIFGPYIYALSGDGDVLLVAVGAHLETAVGSIYRAVCDQHRAECDFTQENLIFRQLFLSSIGSSG